MRCTCPNWPHEIDPDCVNPCECDDCGACERCRSHMGDDRRQAERRVAFWGALEDREVEFPLQGPQERTGTERRRSDG